jgi:hypothetical protein
MQLMILIYSNINLFPDYNKQNKEQKKNKSWNDWKKASPPPPKKEKWAYIHFLRFHIYYNKPPSDRETSFLKMKSDKSQLNLKV